MYFEHATMARHILDGTRAHGTSPTRILEEAGVDPALVEPPALHTPWPAMQSLFRAAGRLTGCPALGLQAGSAGTFSLLEMAGAYILNQPTIGDGMRVVWGQLQPRATNLFRSEILESGDAATIRLHRAPADPDQLDQTIEFYLTATVTAFRLILGPEWIPRGVRFRHAPLADPAGYRSATGRLPEFGQPYDELEVDRTLLEFKLPLADPNLLAVIKPEYQAYLDALEHDLAVTLWLRQTVQHAIAEGAALQLGEIANRMRMRPRTLQHKLKEEGTSFNAVRDAFRRDVALRELASPRVTLDALAHKLDFSDTTAFVRAFRRWTGATPGQWRARS